MNSGNWKPCKGSSCSEISASLAMYCAGELSKDSAAKVEGHLEACASCGQELARENLLRDSLGSLPEVECPREVTGNILRAIGEIEGGDLSPLSRPSRVKSLTRKWPAMVGYAAAAAAAVMLLAGPRLSLDPSPETSESGITAQASGSTYSEADIAEARRDLQLSLLRTAAIINRTERATLHTVFGQALPATVSRSLKTIMSTPEGGQG